MFIYIADDKGWIKILEISKLIEAHQIQKEEYKGEKPSYNPRRRDKKNVDSDVKYWQRLSERAALPEHTKFQDSPYLLQE